MILRYNHEDEIISLLSSDDALYHFTKKETAIEKIWNSRLLRFGSFGLTSDPHEYKPRMTSVSGWGWDESLEKKLPTITRLIDEKIKSSGFLAFCQNRFENDKVTEQGCLKSRMWSQYGANHTGICLVFSKQNLLQEIKKTHSESHFIFLDTVKYQNLHKSRARGSLSIDGGDLDNSSVDEFVHNHIETSYEQIFFSKQPDYQDENEFRVVILAKGGEPSNGVLIDISLSLKVVVLGDAFPDVYLPTIYKLSEKTMVPFRKLHWENGQFFLLKIDKNER